MRKKYTIEIIITDTETQNKLQGSLTSELIDEVKELHGINIIDEMINEMINQLHNE